MDANETNTAVITFNDPELDIMIDEEKVKTKRANREGIKITRE
jgi:hypothetical protein